MINHVLPQDTEAEGTTGYGLGGDTSYRLGRDHRIQTETGYDFVTDRLRRDHGIRICRLGRNTEWAGKGT